MGPDIFAPYLVLHGSRDLCVQILKRKRKWGKPSRMRQFPGQVVENGRYVKLERKKWPKVTECPEVRSENCTIAMRVDSHGLFVPS